MINISALTVEERDLYEKLLSKLPKTITETDYAIFVALLTILMNDVNLRIGSPLYTYNEDGSIAEMRVSDLYRQFDVNTADEPYLRELARLVGYDWLEILSVEANRARLAHHGYRRKYRGTLDSIKNLIRASVDEEAFYSNAENNRIQIIENGHIITVELPEDFLIFRTDIEEVRPAGTLIQFLYHIIIKLALLNVDVQDNMNQYTIQIQNARVAKETIDATADELQHLPKFCRDDLGQSRLLRSIWNRPIIMMSTTFLYTNTLYVETTVITDPVVGS